MRITNISLSELKNLYVNKNIVKSRIVLNKWVKKNDSTYFSKEGTSINLYIRDLISKSDLSISLQETDLFKLVNIVAKCKTLTGPIEVSDREVGRTHVRLTKKFTGKKHYEIVGGSSPAIKVYKDLIEELGDFYIYIDLTYVKILSKDCRSLILLDRPSISNLLANCLIYLKLDYLLLKSVDFRDDLDKCDFDKSLIAEGNAYILRTSNGISIINRELFSECLNLYHTDKLNSLYNICGVEVRGIDLRGQKLLYNVPVKYESKVLLEIARDGKYIYIPIIELRPTKFNKVKSLFEWELFEPVLENAKYVKNSKCLLNDIYPKQIRRCFK